MSENKKVIKYKVCVECKTRFVVRRKWQKFCTSKCRIKNWESLHPRTLLMEV